MKRTITSTMIVTVFAGLLHLTASVGRAQIDTGSITGTVTDATGAALPGAILIATNEATRISAQTVTNEQGHYVITPLRAGRYTLTEVLRSVGLRSAGRF